MSKEIWAEWALTATGWQRDVAVGVSGSGRITELRAGATANDEAERVAILLPAISNLHSHSFQRAMAGLTERRGARGNDSFWTWRQWMYRFVGSIKPQDMQSIAAMVQMEMLQAGYAAVAEFHYLHHAPAGQRYTNPAEMSERIIEAAQTSGIGLTLLPVLYQRGGCDGRPLNDAQKRFAHSLDEYFSLLQHAEKAVQQLPSDSRCGVALHSLRAVETEALQHLDINYSSGPVHIHIAEQTAEVEEVQAAYGARPVQWLLDNANVDERWCLIHATHMDNNETEAFARSGAVAGLCPITEANLGDGIFNGVQFKKSGGCFGVGSDSNVRIALAEELRLYEYSQRLQQRGRTLLADEDSSNGRYLYESSAHGGAQALGRECGQLSVGQWADMLALDASAAPLIERREDDILDSWIFAGDDSLVQDVWSAGRHVVKSGRHIHREKIEQDFAATIRQLLNE